MEPPSASPAKAPDPTTGGWPRLLDRVMKAQDACGLHGLAAPNYYLLAVGWVALALGIRELVGPADLGLQFVTFFPAVALTAIIGGFWPGMLAATLSAALATFLYIPPYREFSFDFQRATLLLNLSFFVDGVIVCGAIHALRIHYFNQRVANRRVAESRNLLNAVIEGTTDAIFLKDATGRYLLNNGAHARLVGRRVAGNNLSAFDVFPAEVAQVLTDEDAQVMATGRVETFDETLTAASGEIRNFVTTKGPVFDEQGRVCGMFGIARDVTEQLRAENLIRDSEARYRSLFNHMQQALVYGRVFFDEGRARDFIILEVNPAFELMTGRRNVAGKMISELVPDIRAMDPELLVTCGRVAAGGKPERYERYAPIVQNWVSVSIYSPAADHFVAIFDVITERKMIEDALRASEEFNRRIIASSSDCINVLDLEGNLVSMSEGGQRLFEIADIGRYIASPWIDFWQAQDRSAVSAALADAYAGGQGRFQAYCATEKGAPKWWDVVVTPVVGAGGSPERLLAVAHDVTERKATEDQLRAAKIAAERANMAKSRFLAAASHDLRQPLSALSIYVGLLGHKLGPADGALVSNMHNCVSSLSELLGDLLDLSKLDAGVVKVNVSDFTVGGILAKLISSHAPEAQLKGLQLRYRSCERNVRTDAVLLERIVGNFISNAIRYTERGGVLVACRRHGGRSWVEVWDTGIGIPADKTTEIFEEFKQLGDDARNRGSGLGLAIVAKMAALLDLRVRVESRPGRGSLFAIELPPGQAGEVLAKVEFKHAPQGGRIALVEDNPIVRESLVYGLQSEGHDVIAAGSGYELWMKLDGCPPDVVLADYRLQDGETGVDVIAAVRARFGQNVPSIIFTGDTDPNLLRSMADRGVLVQHKPVELETLQACIEGMMLDKPAA